MLNEQHMRLLRGKPIKVGLINVYPWTLGEIDDFGESNYNIFISLLLTNKDKLSEVEGIDKDALSEISDYEAMCGLVLGNKDTERIMLSGLTKTFNTDVSFDAYNGFFIKYNETSVYLNGLYKDIQKVIEAQNVLNANNKSDFNPANKAAKKMYEKIIERRNKVLKKQKKDKGSSLSDIISVVSTYKDGLNLNNIWDLTVYQLYDHYFRLLIWDDYRVSSIHLPHMDEKDRKKIKHWSLPIKEFF